MENSIKNFKVSFNENCIGVDFETRIESEKTEISNIEKITGDIQLPLCQESQHFFLIEYKSGKREIVEDLDELLEENEKVKYDLLQEIISQVEKKATWNDIYGGEHNLIFTDSKIGEKWLIIWNSKDVNKLHISYTLRKRNAVSDYYNVEIYDEEADFSEICDEETAKEILAEAKDLVVLKEADIIFDNYEKSYNKLRKKLFNTDIKKSN